MKVEDVFVQNRRLWARLREKGGKRHEMPCHHNLEVYLQAYLEGGGISADPKGPLFRTIGRTTGQLTRTPLPQANAYAMMRRRAAAAGIKTRVGNHTCRATGITAYLKNGGTLENAAAMANHASTRTTQLYDRRRDNVSLEGADQLLRLRPHPVAAGIGPRRTDGAIVLPPADDRDVAVGRQRDRAALLRASDGARTEQLRLLSPDPAAAGINPRRSKVRIVMGGAHDGCIAVARQCDSLALPFVGSEPAVADQLRRLLGELRQRQLRAAEQRENDRCDGSCDMRVIWPHCGHEMFQ
jgi:hypothetical protein